MAQSIGGHSMSKLLRMADDTVKQKTKDSQILDPAAERVLPNFASEELFLGSMLGKGGFCTVKEVVRIQLLGTEETESSTPVVDEDDEHKIHNIVQNRGFMQDYCLRGTGHDCRYALKKLSPECLEDASKFVNGVVDLAMEARFLAVIRHPNIIKMRAFMKGSFFQADFFVVLDRLYDILNQRISKWKKLQPSGFRKMMDRKGKKSNAQYVERLTVIYDLASALSYLHEHGIIYRDIKPDNIGFDVRDDVKIFDFGLAREFKLAKQAEGGMYLMTADTGSPRYMAPEVALGKPYNENADVYSLSILAWQILKLETPYATFSMNMLRRTIYEKGARPVCDPKWSGIVTNLLQKSWAAPEKRPTMAQVVDKIENELNKNSSDPVLHLDASEKSLRMKQASSQ